MDTMFQTLFSQEPEEIQDGAYYFKIPDRPGFDTSYTLEQEVLSKGIDPKDFFRQRKEWCERELRSSYESRSIDAPYEEAACWSFQRFLQGADANPKILEVFRKIAEKGNPFMDLGSYHMGLAPYILHLNPNAPCLLTNREKHYVGVLSSCIRENFENHSIEVAFFDELHIPLQRESIDVVTGVSPLSGPSQNRPIDSRVISLDEMRKWFIMNVLMEVNRVLKPGGYFILSEFGSSMNFSWTELDEFFDKHEKIYGYYAKDEFYESLRTHKDREKYALHDDMIKVAGFDIEIKDTYSYKDNFENMPNWFYKEELPKKTRELIPEDDLVELEFTESLYVLRKRK
jgi:SAM-dependent methyltransferase